MFCVPCRRFPQLAGGKDTQWVQGSTNFRKTSLEKHQDSSKHVVCAKRAEALDAGQGKSEASRVLQSLNKSQMERLSILFRNAHAVAKKGRPYTDYVWMCQLDQMKGLTVGETYLTNKKAHEFVHYIAEVERAKLIELLKGKGSMSIITDGSTDSSITEQELLYVRVAEHGNIHTQFLSVEPVEKADAENITNAICNAVEQLGDGMTDIVKGKLVAFGSDGAAVMTGVHNGVVARVRRQLQPLMIGIHCLAHRLELAFKNVTKNDRLAGNLDRLLLNLYLFYHNSNLNRANLRNAFKANGESPLVPTRVGGTRWIPHTDRALDHLIRGYKSIITHLEQVCLSIC